MIGAAVDVGSNSVHLLVARLDRGRLEYLRDQSEQLGLGDIVDHSGIIPDDAQQLLIHLLEGYRGLAGHERADVVTFLATEPLRRAANGAAVAERVERETGIALHILDRHAEGELTFLGVTGGRPVAESLLVVDIGGGSTEVILFEPGRALEVTGVATGSSRLSNETVRHDPPTARELSRLRQAARELVATLPAAQPRRAVFVGGTATNLVKIGPLAHDAFDELYSVIRSGPAADVAGRFRLKLRRTLQIAAGAALVEALLDRYELPRAEVSDASLRDGAILVGAGRGLPTASAT